MDPITQQTTLAAAGGKKDPVYVDDVFSTYLYDGNDANGRDIPNGIDLDGEGGMVWIKRRNGDHSHCLFDTERGVDSLLHSDAVDIADTSGGGITAFNSDGFTIDNTSSPHINDLNDTFASWTFRKAPGFFDVVTYTGNAPDTTTGREIPHSLGSVPGMIIVKKLNDANNWEVYHRSLAYNYFIQLNSSNAASATGGINRWRNTAPTSSVFTVGYTNNTPGATYVAYIFAHDEPVFGTDEDESIIKCGSYTGNYSSTSPINLGFEPSFVILKCTSENTDYDWRIFDNMRGVFTGSNDISLVANTYYGELAGTNYDRDYISFTPTGFEVKSTDNSVAESGKNFIYMAIRRPNKPPEAGTDVFAIDTRGGTSPTPPTYYSGFPVDWFLGRDTEANDWTVKTRLTGNNTLSTVYNSAESSSTSTYYTFDQSKGLGEHTNVTSTKHGWMFKRAPGFFDVVAYDGTGSTTNHNHNLGVVPELMLVKCRSHDENWRVYAAPLGATKSLVLNSVSEASTSSNFWNDTAPTSSVFTVPNYDGVNGSGKTYINYLFATLPGISKVGSYSGNTSTAVDVDCGFTNGARFVLIKCSDYVFNPTIPFGWFVWDTTRGIVSGNDPYIHLNTTQAQVTDTDYIDPLSTGFTVTSSAPPALNLSGKNYIFLAIA